jgi:hypothetical protein
MEIPGKRKFQAHTSVETDENGRFDVGLSHAPGVDEFTLTVEKQGYEEHREEIDAGSNIENYDVTLSPAKK